MEIRLKLLIPRILIIAVILFFVWPVSKPSFEELYADVDQEMVDSLVAFREVNSLKTVMVKDKNWEIGAFFSNQ